MYEISKLLWSPLQTEPPFDHHQSRDQSRWMEWEIIWKLLFRSPIGYCWMIDFDIQIDPGDLTNASKCKSNHSSRNQIDWFKIDLNASLHESKARNLKFKLWLLFPNALIYIHFVMPPIWRKFKEFFMLLLFIRQKNIHEKQTNWTEEMKMQSKNEKRTKSNPTELHNLKIKFSSATFKTRKRFLKIELISV